MNKKKYANLKVYIARPRGFCAGVDRAIDIVKLALKKYQHPVFVRHEIVHNRHVVEDLRKSGAIFVEDFENVPEGSIIIFSAHGVSPEVRRQALAKNLHIIDATCPLVTKVHLKAIRFAKLGYHIVMIGHRNHVEVIGTKGEAPDNITVVEDLRDIENLEVPDPEKVAIITQTTLSLNDSAIMIDALRKKFPSIVKPKDNDICYATTNRQKAVMEMAKMCDMILVIGSPSSSNSNRLVEVALSNGSRAVLIDDATQIEASMLENVNNLGITAGASAPEFIVQSIISWLKKHYRTEFEYIDTGVEEVSFTIKENVI